MKTILDLFDTSRMHTARLLTVSPSMHCTGRWEVVGGGGGECGGVCSGGVPGPRGVVSQHALRQTPPRETEFLTHVTENITLPQTSFRAVKIAVFQSISSNSVVLNCFNRLNSLG